MTRLSTPVNEIRIASGRRPPTANFSTPKSLIFRFTTSFTLSRTFQWNGRVSQTVLCSELSKKCPAKIFRNRLSKADCFQVTSRKSMFNYQILWSVNNFADRYEDFPS